MRSRLLLATALSILAATATVQASKTIDWQWIFTDTASGIVALKAESGETFCTGWILNERKGLVMTADHCVAGAYEQYLSDIYIDGEVAAEIRHFPERDMALLHVPGMMDQSWWEWLLRLDRRLKPSKGVKAGDAIMGVGFPFGDKMDYRVSVVIATDMVSPYDPGVWLSSETAAIPVCLAGLNWTNTVVWRGWFSGQWFQLPVSACSTTGIRQRIYWHLRQSGASNHKISW